LLDLLFKKKAFFSKRAADQAELTLVEAVCNEIKKLKRKINVAEYATPDSSKQRKVDSASRFATAHFASLEESSRCSEDDAPELQESSCYNAAKALVSAYLSEPRCKVDDPSLQFWRTNGSRFPEMARLALKFLSAPLSSVASEREFKIARDLTNGNRNRLRSRNVQRLLFLSATWKSSGIILFRYPGFQMNRNNIRSKMKRKAAFLIATCKGPAWTFVAGVH